MGKLTLQHSRALKEKTKMINDLHDKISHKEQKHENHIKTMKEELVATRELTQEQLDGLMSELKHKSIEINKLKINIRTLGLDKDKNFEKQLEKIGASTHMYESSNP